MENWKFRKAGFKSECSLQVFEGYFLNEFKGYFYKAKNYQLITKKGSKQLEKFIGYKYEIFSRKINGNFLTWEEWKEKTQTF